MALLETNTGGKEIKRNININSKPTNGKGDKRRKEDCKKVRNNWTTIKGFRKCKYE